MSIGWAMTKLSRFMLWALEDQLYLIKPRPFNRYKHTDYTKEALILLKGSLGSSIVNTVASRVIFLTTLRSKSKQRGGPGHLILLHFAVSLL
jgi:hypothetical protein